MSKFTVRPARSKDASAIAKVHIQAWQETYAGLIPQFSSTKEPAQNFPHKLNSLNLVESY